MTAKYLIKTAGFTLIEMIVGILVLAIALTLVTNVFAPQVEKGIDPIWQTRSVALAQSLISEINAKAFDEQSPSGNATDRCNEGTDCTQSGNLGPDGGEARSDFDDVDDYDGLVISGSSIVDLLGGGVSYQGIDIYNGFEAEVSVFYDANQDGINDDDIDQNGTLDTGTLTANRKLIQVIITMPNQEQMAFSSFRDNY